MSLLKKLFSAPAPLEQMQPDAPDAVREIRRRIERRHLDDVFPWLNRFKAARVPRRNDDYQRAQCFLGKNQPAAALEAVKEELRYFPEHPDAAALLRQLQPAPAAAAAADPEFVRLLEVIRPYTMLSEARLRSLFTLAKAVCVDNLPGNFVECGVAAGGSSALLAALIARHSTRERRLFACDTFQGMPVPTVEDTHRGQPADQTGWGTGTCAAPQEALQAACRLLDAEKFVEPIQGLFGDTLPVHRARIGPIAFLHMDGDWYSSTRDILVNLFDQVLPGGRIQIDDYGHWEGCQRAVAEFAQERGLRFDLHQIDETGVWMAK